MEVKRLSNFWPRVTEKKQTMTVGKITTLRIIILRSFYKQSWWTGGREICQGIFNFQMGR